MAEKTPDDELSELAALRAENARLQKINKVLMNRVERSVDQQGGAYSLFQAATALEKKVEVRTSALQRAMVELERSNEEITAAKEAADAANTAKSQFLANMSHEIRTPMNGVMGMAELLMGSNLSERQEKLVETIQKSSESLLSIINNILDFSKIEAGRLELEDEPFDVVDAVEDTVELLAERAQRKGLEFACYIDGDVHTRVRGDAGRLRQVLTNLIANAIKFTERGEVVVRVTEAGQAGSMRFEVADTGIGLSRDAHGRVFESFNQADGSTTRRYGGTGLGLAIAKQLVNAMGGDIGLSSELGEGSLFWFTAALTPNFDADEEVASATNEFTGLRALVVDDHATQRRILAALLSEWNCQVEVVDSISAAIDALDRAHLNGRPFQFAAIDGRLPDGAGAELIAQLHESRRHRTLPCLLLNSVIDDENNKVKSSARVAVLSKPVRRARLRGAVGRVLGRGRREDPRSKTGPQMAIRSTAAGLRVLVAEDNPINQEVALGMLEALGCRPVVVGNGRLAVQALSEGEFDIVLMDCQMPEMDGFEATRVIRAREQGAVARAPMRIIALTANARQDDRDRCVAAGMDAFLSKPYTLEQLRQVLLQEGSREEETVSMSAESRPCVDERAIERIKEFGGGPGPGSLVVRIIDMYLEVTPRQLEELARAAANHDAQTVMHLTHSLKSSSLNVGLNCLGTAAALVEKRAREGSVAEAARSMEQMKKLFADGAAALRAVRELELSGSDAQGVST